MMPHDTTQDSAMQHKAPHQTTPLHSTPRDASIHMAHTINTLPGQEVSPEPAAAPVARPARRGCHQVPPLRSPEPHPNPRQVGRTEDRPLHINPSPPTSSCSFPPVSCMICSILTTLLQMLGFAFVCNVFHAASVGASDTCILR